MIDEFTGVPPPSDAGTAAVDGPRAPTDRRRFDRSRDVRGWLLTPLAALLVGSAVAFGLLVLVVEGYSDSSPYGYSMTAFCISQELNGCEEAGLRWLGWGLRAFVVTWGAMWLLPWWRGLRPVRLGLAATVVLVMAAVPARLIWPTWFPTDW
ncbi:hypothetical protein [Actinoplanes sp. NPDC051859]|uniref:hypothetical protein n=1 Tax=Actinoplanes sp. NPDC051859 TaxID=3363909 RepID=UPI0037AD82E0